MRDSVISALDSVSRQVKIGFLATLPELLSRAEYDLSEVEPMINDYNMARAPICSCHSPWEQRRSVRLVRFDREISTDEARGALNETGLRPGTIHEYLELVAAYPELRTEVPVVMLGSVLPPHTVSAYNSFAVRRISLAQSHTGKWGPLCWFIAVDKHCPQ